MKTIIALATILICLTETKAQVFDSTANYADSVITLTLTQRSAIYMGAYVKHYKLSWANRNAPTIFRPYVASGNNLDSLFTVTLQGWYVTGMLELLLTGQNEAVQADRLSIISNSPSIPSYTALATQVVNKANGSSSEKWVAQYILNYYNSKVASLAALRAQTIYDVIQWSRN